MNRPRSRQRQEWKCLSQCSLRLCHLGHAPPWISGPLIWSGTCSTGPPGTWRWPFPGLGVRKADEELRGGLYCEDREVASGHNPARSILFEYLNQLDFKFE